MKMKRLNLTFVLVVMVVMIVAGLVAFISQQPLQPLGSVAGAPLDLEAMAARLTPEQRQAELRKLFAQQVRPSEQDEPGQPPFETQLREGLAKSTAYVEGRIAENTYWKLYERCRAEHAADGFDEKRAHQACVFEYNMALGEYLDTFFLEAVYNEHLPAFYRARFHKDAVYAEVNRILKESNNVLERLVALKLIQESPLIEGGAPLDLEIYHHLDRYSSPELTILFDQRFDVPRTDPIVLDALTEHATRVVESVETANRAATLLGSPQNAERIVKVVDTVMQAPWQRSMRYLPRGVANALGECGGPCAAGFERLAADGNDPFVSTLLYTALFGVRDPDERRRLALQVESRLPPLSPAQTDEMEHRAAVFARLTGE